MQRGLPCQIPLHKATKDTWKAHNEVFLLVIPAHHLTRKALPEKVTTERTESWKTEIELRITHSQRGQYKRSSFHWVPLLWLKHALATPPNSPRFAPIVKDHLHQERSFETDGCMYERQHRWRGPAEKKERVRGRNTCWKNTKRWPRCHCNAVRCVAMIVYDV